MTTFVSDRTPGGAAPFFRLGPGEAAACLDLALRAYGPYFPLLGAPHADALKKNLSDPGLWHGLLEEVTGIGQQQKGMLIAMAFVLKSGQQRGIFPKEWASMRMVGVDPAYSGQGIGRRLLQTCLEHTRQTGEEILALHTGAFMKAACHLYESMGFRRFRRIDDRFGQPYWVYTLHLNDQISL